jgi:alkylation response protein AidB-like acyl-CoA dehydrogenase
MSAAIFEEPAELNELSDDDFCMLVRRFIEENYPPELRNPPSRLHYKDTKVWYQKLARKGWLCPNWPREFGGMGISAGKQLIMLEEKERHGCARLNEMGMTMLGPLLIRHGTKEQQDFYLPKILTGEQRGFRSRLAAYRGGAGWR